jgi:predicted nucleic acid-binding protein
VVKQLNLNFTGLIGVLKRAKMEGIIPSLKDALIKVQKTNFRVAEETLCFKCEH